MVTVANGQKTIELSRLSGTQKKCRWVSGMGMQDK
jgi:hypothetical protein